MLAISLDQNNNCKIMIENYAPYDITIEMNDLMGLIEMEEDKLILLTDDVISLSVPAFTQNYPKFKDPF
jgi:hypothetical protein